MIRAAACLLAVLSFPAVAQYPVKPIRVVLTVSAAGDLTVRTLAEKMAPTLGQPIVVEIQSAAGGAQGATTVARAAPDGYTLLYGTIGAMVLRQFLVKDLPYDTVRDFTPIAKVGEAVAAIVASSAFPPNNFAEMIEFARRNPGKVSYATTGIGSTHHMTGILFEQLTGIRWVHIPYKTGPQSAQDLAGGRVPVAIGTLTTYKSMVDAGKAKVIAINGAERYTEMPNVPTVGEVLPGYDRPAGWMAFFGPAGLPQPIVRRMETELIRAASDAGVKAKLLTAGVLIDTLPADRFAAAIRRDIEMSARLIKAAGIQPE
jgi:tripartite-type tricarboxylate transporter receptor subunit TctC